MITPTTYTDRAALASLKGAQLLGVTYHYLPPAGGSGYAGDEDGVDTDLAAVVLDFGDQGTTAITWAMVGELEGLAILSGASYSGTVSEALDAADRPAWREYIGDSIRSVAASWHISNDECPESLWATRISFAAGSIVIALGCADPGVDYMPNELVVIFDPLLSRSYQPKHVSYSSWGVPIEPT